MGVSELSVKTMASVKFKFLKGSEFQVLLGFNDQRSWKVVFFNFFKSFYPLFFNGCDHSWFLLVGLHHVSACVGFGGPGNGEREGSGAFAVRARRVWDKGQPRRVPAPANDDNCVDPVLSLVFTYGSQWIIPSMFPNYCFYLEFIFKEYAQPADSSKIPTLNMPQTVSETLVETPIFMKGKAIADNLLFFFQREKPSAMGKAKSCRIFSKTTKSFFSQWSRGHGY